MNETEYRQARARLSEAIERKDWETVSAIRTLILVFYNPKRENNA